MESEEEWRKRNVMHERSWIWAESTRREREREKNDSVEHTAHNEITDDDEFWGRAAQANELQMIFSFSHVLYPYSIWYA